MFVVCVHYAVFDTPCWFVWLTDAHLFVLSGWLCRWFIAAGKRPVPFRTRKLSLRRADGTALGRVWESRLLPTLYNFMFGPVGCGYTVCTQGGCAVVIAADRPILVYLYTPTPLGTPGIVCGGAIVHVAHQVRSYRLLAFAPYRRHRGAYFRGSTF